MLYLKTFVLLKKYFLLILAITWVGIFGCSKNTNQSPAPTTTNNNAQNPDSTITDSSIFIDITLDNERILRIQNPNDVTTWAVIWGSSPADSTVYPYNRIGSSFSDNEATLRPSFEFSKGNVAFRTIAGLSQNFTDSFFMPGNYSYSVKTVDTSYDYIGTPTDTLTLFAQFYTKTLLTPGVNLLYYDSSGTAWETFNGTADQTGSHFTITDAQPIMNGNTTGKPIGAIITANFDSILYDNKGIAKHLTDGKFRQVVYY
jgi:hypothetical protein